MATTPEEVQQQPKIVQRVARAIAAPVSDQAGRQRIVYGVAAAAATAAPQPFAAILAVSILVLAYDRKR